jgi:hypothetical protein
MRRLTRRTWLAGLLLAGGLAGGWHWRRLRRPEAADLAALLRDRLSHVPFEVETVDRFAREYVRRYGPLAMSAHHRDTFGGLLRIEAVGRLLPDRYGRDVVDFERRLVALCLRSTTYFSEPGEPVRFVAFADPYEVGCANPLARFE